jgi:hypothetical protein
MNIKHPAVFFFSKWWRPVIVAGAGFFVYAIGGFTHSRLWEGVCEYVFGFTLLILVVSLVYQLARKNREAALNTAVSFIVVFAAIFFYGIFLFIMDRIAPEDGYADNLVIPANIKINEPKGNKLQETDRPDSILNIKRTKPDFELFYSLQPGLYEYDIWCRKIEQGKVFLKAFEITHNDPLSADVLQENSSIAVYNPSENMMRFHSNHPFTIYEGDWGKPYAARFEVWFKPENGGKEMKLLEKNYKIEGWMQ